MRKLQGNEPHSMACATMQDTLYEELEEHYKDDKEVKQHYFTIVCPWGPSGPHESGLRAR